MDCIRDCESAEQSLLKRVYSADRNNAASGMIKTIIASDFVSYESLQITKKEKQKLDSLLLAYRL